MLQSFFDIYNYFLSYYNYYLGSDYYVNKYSYEVLQELKKNNINLEENLKLLKNYNRNINHNTHIFTIILYLENEIKFEELKDQLLLKNSQEQEKEEDYEDIVQKITKISNLKKLLEDYNFVKTILIKNNYVL